MGQIVVVPGATDDMLRQAIVEMLMDSLELLPELGDHEFTARDVVRQTGRNRNWVERQLEKLVDQGVLKWAWRIDPRTNRRVKAYFRPNHGGPEGQGVEKET